MTFAEWLRNTMERKGITTEELARKIWVDLNHQETWWNANTGHTVAIIFKRGTIVSVILDGMPLIQIGDEQ